MLLSETYRPPKDYEILEILSSLNSLEEKYTYINILVDKKTNDHYISTDKRDKIKIFFRTGDISLIKSDGRRFVIDKKTGKRDKKKK